MALDRVALPSQHPDVAAGTVEITFTGFAVVRFGRLRIDAVDNVVFGRGQGAFENISGGFWVEARSNGLLSDEAVRRVVDTVAAAVSDIVELLEGVDEPEIQAHDDQSWEVLVAGRVPDEAPGDWRDQLAAAFRALLAAAESLPPSVTDGEASESGGDD